MTNTAQTIGRIVLGLFLILAGAGHLSWSRTEFVAQVPHWLPLSADLVVILSGIVEICLGLALVFLVNQKTTIGWLAAAFFVLVFPGNIAQYLNHTPAFGLDTDAKRAIRLLFQPLLVLWALWSTGAWRAWRHTK
jgi:uncharacterized membrane protein